MSTIVDCRVIVCSPGRNFVTLKIIDSDGVVGSERVGKVLGVPA